MKLFNIMFGSLALVVVGVHASCLVTDYFGVRFLSIIPAIALGIYSRRIVEKIFGYTLEQAVKEDSNEQK
jgi:hypothetical protein